MSFINRIAKMVVFGTPTHRALLPVMKFDMTIAQLHFLTSALLKLTCKGCVIEIGVGGGSTSVMLLKFMRENGIGRPYIALDTFSGFVAEDVQVERRQRGKAFRYDGYRNNRKDWYEKTLKAHGVTPNTIIQADAKKVDFAQFAPIAFCLFDVDLYSPTKAVLPSVYSALAPGGLLVVDDCAPEPSMFDGAGQAYREFCVDNGLQIEIQERKLGIVRRARFDALP